MERFTKRNDDGTVFYPHCLDGGCKYGFLSCNDCEYQTQMDERLAAYEDLGYSPEELKVILTERTNGK